MWFSTLFRCFYCLTIVQPTSSNVPVCRRGGNRWIERRHSFGTLTCFSTRNWNCYASLQCWLVVWILFGFHGEEKTGKNVTRVLSRRNWWKFSNARWQIRRGATHMTTQTFKWRQLMNCATLFISSWITIRSWTSSWLGLACKWYSLTMVDISIFLFEGVVNV